MREIRELERESVRQLLQGQKPSNLVMTEGGKFTVRSDTNQNTPDGRQEIHLPKSTFA